MKEKYFKIFSSLANINVPSIKLNDRILIIDGLNSFIRAFAASPVTSENGYHIGGVSGFLQTIGYAIKTINPTRVIIAFDGKGGSVRRRKLYPEYKAGRKTHINIINTDLYSTKEEEQDSMNTQLRTLLEFLSYLPLRSISVDMIEADDVIAFLAIHFANEYKSKCYIMSTDKDFLQLVSENILVWSPTKKKLYNKEVLAEEYEGLNPDNFVYYKSLTGDASDNIPGIKGIGLRTLKKRIPIMFDESKKISLNDIIIYAQEKINESTIYKSIYENQSQLDLNYRLVQLHDVEISGTTKLKILNNIDKPIPRLNKPKFISGTIREGLHTISVFKSPDLWLRTNFAKLDSFAMSKNKE